MKALTKQGLHRCSALAGTTPVEVLDADPSENGVRRCSHYTVSKSQARSRSCVVVRLILTPTQQPCAVQLSLFREDSCPIDNLPVHTWSLSTNGRAAYLYLESDTYPGFRPGGGHLLSKGPPGHPGPLMRPGAMKPGALG